MRKQSILCLLIIVLALLCSCSNNTPTLSGDVSYKEAELLDYTKVYNTTAILMFEANSNSNEIGTLYIKGFDKEDEKIATNVYKEKYTLFNNNNVVYIDSDNSLFFKEYGKESKKVADKI